ncbi:Excision repair cross-complementation group 1 [Irineochytrium annulatum]|nr:Excision repair cross-complementation group 1 [Irineochytrium annulatum]
MYRPPGVNGAGGGGQPGVQGPLLRPQVSARRVTRVLVNPRQKGNPVLDYVKAVPWEFEKDILPDFQMGDTTCALFLSLQYHRLHPEYIFERIKSLQRNYNLRVLLVLVDINDHQQSLRELTKAAILAQFTLFLSWSVEEAGRYIETFKAYENKTAEMIMGRVDGDYLSKLTECLTQVKSVNKTDVLTLATTFGSLGEIMNASADELALCPGLGEQKVRRLVKAFNEPFVLNKKERGRPARRRSEDEGVKNE